jgi:hypothetical protein
MSVGQNAGNTKGIFSDDQIAAFGHVRYFAHQICAAFADSDNNDSLVAELVHIVVKVVSSLIDSVKQQQKQLFFSVTSDVLFL